ncbi:MAG: Slp family lipoprotein [Pseudomonadota bacterium]
MTHLRPALFRTIMLAGLLLLMAGCTTIPTPLEGEFNDFYPEQAIERSVGAQVRWGGTVVQAQPQAEQTCVEVLARELDSRYRPEISDQSHGRFLACRPIFLDPEIFVNGREVTVVGRVDGFETGSIGEFNYNYPRVDAEAIYLWPERSEEYYYPYYASNLWWGWPYSHPFYSRGFYRFHYGGFYPFHHPYRHVRRGSGTVHSAPAQSGTTQPQN